MLPALLACLSEIERDLDDLGLSSLQRHAVMWRLQSRMAACSSALEERKPRTLADIARSLHRLRLKANDIAGAELLRDPRWEMLLYLFVARDEERLTSVSALCLASNVPATTGLRYVEVLLNAGYVRRVDDAADGRRTWVEATEKGVGTVRRLLEAYQREMQADNRALTI